MKKARKEKSKVVTKKICRAVKRNDGLEMKFMTEYTFRNFHEVIASRYPRRTMYSVFREDGSEITFLQFSHQVKAISSYLISLGFEKGDKVAIIGDSSPYWMLFYVALTNIGLIAVPILPEFSEREVAIILSDSEAKGVASLSKQYPKVFESIKETGLSLFRLDDLVHIPSSVGIPEPVDFLSTPGIPMRDWKISQKDLDSFKPEEDDIASIIYTSGTTGKSKGVVLSHKNLLRCADLNTDVYIKLKPGNKVLSILPMSHVYEFTIGQLLVLLQGLEVVFLGKPPAVSILLPALSEVRPHVMLTVPLLIEKVYKAAIAPKLKGEGKIAKLAKNPFVSSFVYRTIGKKLKSTFGGRIKFFGIGGAPLDAEVEKFLYKASFPYSIGYGLTETSPLIAGCNTKKSGHSPSFIGPVVSDDDVILLDKNQEGVGEIAVKGPNVTKGYYKNEELNKESFTPDGYFKTGDLGYFDKKGRLSIRGRVKTMILGPSGENIYPESIESLINNQEYVAESLVVPEDGGLIALIRIDIELMSKNLKISVDEAKKEAVKYVASMKKSLNSQLSSYSRLSETELQEEPFDRTPTQKIKRFLYPKKKKE